ncbi:MAG: hypothetical protein ACREH3_12690, partial [Geminicoccales bacterium]
MSESLERATFKALAKVPADRYGTAAEFAEALAEVSHERVRATGPVAGTLGGGSGRNGEVAFAAGERTSGASGREAIRPTIYRVAVGLVVTVAFLTLIGMVTQWLFDSELQVPAQYVPTRADFPIMGARAVFPSTVYAIGAVIGFLVIRYLIRSLFWA